MPDGAQDTVAVRPRMGIGEFPHELDRMNWATVLWGGVWLLVYGAWSWFFVLFAIGIGFSGVQTLLSMAAASLPIRVGASVLAGLCWYSVLIVFAHRANRQAWKVNQERLAHNPDSRALLVADYVATQRRWVRLGVAFVILFSALNLWNLRATPSLSIQIARTITDACVLLGLLVFTRVAASRRQS